jgi:hypothetical protein
MSFGFLGAPAQDFSETNESVGRCQIRIKRQRPLAFRNALARAVRQHID